MKYHLEVYFLSCLAVLQATRLLRELLVGNTRLRGDFTLQMEWADFWTGILYDDCITGSQWHEFLAVQQASCECNLAYAIAIEAAERLMM